MYILRRFLAVAVAVAAVAALGLGIAGPAHADGPAPNIGDICHPERDILNGNRTVDFWFQNRSDFKFNIIESHLNDGEWGGTAPPVTIEPWEWVCWRSVSNGFLTGTQGWVSYSMDISPETWFSLDWDVPYSIFSNNHFHCHPVPNASCIAVPGSGGGHHPTPIFQMSLR
jgi:hypothetical protein